MHRNRCELAKYFYLIMFYLVINLNNTQINVRSQNTGNRENTATASSKCVLGNECRDCQSYPIESSSSTVIEMFTNSTKTQKIPHTRSPDHLSDHYYADFKNNYQQQR